MTPFCSDLEPTSVLEAPTSVLETRTSVLGKLDPYTWLQLKIRTKLSPFTREDTKDDLILLTFEFWFYSFGPSAFKGFLLGIAYQVQLWTSGSEFLVWSRASTHWNTASAYSPSDFGFLCTNYDLDAFNFLLYLGLSLSDSGSAPTRRATEFWSAAGTTVGGGH